MCGIWYPTNLILNKIWRKEYFARHFLNTKYISLLFVNDFYFKINIKNQNTTSIACIYACSERWSWPFQHFPVEGQEVSFVLCCIYINLIFAQTQEQFVLMWEHWMEIPLVCIGNTWIHSQQHDWDCHCLGYLLVQYIFIRENRDRFACFILFWFNDCWLIAKDCMKWCSILHVNYFAGTPCTKVE